MESGGSPSPPQRRREEYGSTGVSSEVKEHTAALAVSLQDLGVPVSTVVEALKKTAYSPTERTLRRHMAAIKAGQTPLSAEKATGRQPALSEEQWAIVFGWVLQQNAIVNLESVQQWIKANLGLDVSIATISRHKDAKGLSFRLASRRGLSIGTTWDEYVLGYFNFVQSLHSTSFFNHDHKRIVCIDFVTDSRRRELDRTLTLTGAKQPKIARDLPTYTSSYIVAVAYGAGAPLKVLMFTHNPAFKPNGPRWGEVLQWCMANKSSPDQIYFIKSDRHYCKEQQAQVVAFLQRNREALDGANILHDASGAFKMDGEYILAEVANRVVVLPPDQHGELSVLDNKVNAVAKAQWRANRHNQDFAWDAFLLLVYLERVGQDSITSFWTKNFLLDVPELSVRAVEQRLNEVNRRDIVRQHLADKYADAYGQWAEDHNEVVPVYEGDVPLGGLDGPYWK